MIKKIILIISMIISIIYANQKILIPMDINQTNHLKPYGIAYSNLTKNNKVEWLLNYRGGSFLLDFSNQLKKECLLKNVYYEILSMRK
mgnify:CR=1 FL=1